MSRSWGVAVLLLVGLVSPVLGQVKLEYKVGENTTYTTSVDATLKQVMTVQGMNIETGMESHSLVESKVGKREADGTVRMVQTNKSAQTSMKAPGGVEISFDSANPDKEPANPAFKPIVDMYKAMSKASFTLVYDKSGKVTGVEGTEKILENVDPQLQAMVKSQLDSKTLAASVNESLALLPADAVKKGDSWERTDVKRLEGSQNLVFKKKCTYAGTVEQNGVTLDKITVSATEVKLEIGADSPLPVKVSKSDLKIDNSEGVILFDRKLGRIVENTMKCQIKGDIGLNVNGMDLAAKLDLTMDNSSKIR